MAALKKNYKKIALALSLLLMFVWAIMGTGASLAWFTDTSNEVKNIFHFAEFDLVVSHRLEDGTYEEIEFDTKVFDDEALYEPGYTQVVYLKIENKGEVDFDYKMSVDMISFVAGENEMGNPIYLPNYLKFGAVIEKDEVTLNRELARVLATDDLDDGAQPGVEKLPLNTYSSAKGELDAEKGEDSVDYAAIVIYMPEHIGNEANYRGDTIPEVQLGITVKASQRGTLSD